MPGVKSKFSFIMVILLILTLVGTVLLPSIEFSSSIPKVEVSDITFIFVFGILVLQFNNVVAIFLQHNRWMFFWLGLLFSISIVSIIINGTYSHTSNLFEPIKLIKIATFITAFAVYLNLESIKRILVFIFIGLIIFNGLHYFNVLNFNEIIEPFYSPPHHLNYFGLNSIGEPATKRMLGTMANPNNNAILFLMFFLFFLPSKKENDSNYLILPSFAIIGVMLCQSRTGFLLLMILLLSYFVLIRPRLKVVIIFSVVAIGFYFGLFYAGHTYIDSLGNSEIVKGASKGRAVRWKFLIEAFSGHWIIGRGVDKEFLRANNMHAESEYLLMLFRYGFIGLLIFLMFYAQLFFMYIKKVFNRGGFLIPGTLLIFGLAGVTNTPLQSMKLSIIFALAIGIGLRTIHERERV